MHALLQRCCISPSHRANRTGQRGGERARDAPAGAAIGGANDRWVEFNDAHAHTLSEAEVTAAFGKDFYAGLDAEGKDGKDGCDPLEKSGLFDVDDDDVTPWKRGRRGGGGSLARGGAHDTAH